MDHVMPCIFDYVLDPHDTDALTLFLDDLDNDPTGDNILLSNDDTFDSILNEDSKSTFPTGETNQDDMGMVSPFRSPQTPSHSVAPNVQSPAGQNVQQAGSRSTPVQYTVPSPSPRTLQQPSTPGSVADSPYSQHHTATPSPASRQPATPSPLNSPAPAQINQFQQQKTLDVKFLASNLGQVHSPQAKQQLQTHVIIQGQQLQQLQQQQPQLAQNVQSSTAASHQLVSPHVSTLQNSAGTAPVQLQLQGLTQATGTQQAATVAIRPQVQRAVLQTSLGNQIILQPGLHGQVQLRQNVGIAQPTQFVTQASGIQPRQPMVTIAASNIHPPSLQAPPNINIMNLQNQIGQPQQQVLLQQNSGENQNVILTTLPGSNVMQLSTAGNNQPASLQTNMVINQNQAQLLLAKGGQKVQGQVFVQSQPVANVGSQLQIAGVKPGTASPNTVAIQNQGGQIINFQQMAPSGSIMQTTAGQNVMVNQATTGLQNIPQQKHLIQVNGQNMTLTTSQLQQLIALQQKKMLQQPVVQQQTQLSGPVQLQGQVQLQPGQSQVAPQIQLQGQPQVQSQPQLHGQPQVLNSARLQGAQPVQVLQQGDIRTQVMAASSTTPIVAGRPVAASSSPQTQATQVAVQQNLLEIRDKFMKQNPNHPPPLVGDLQASSQSNIAGSVQGITRVVTMSSQAQGGIRVGSAQTSMGSLTQQGGLTVVGAAGQPLHNNKPINIMGQGPMVAQTVVQQPQPNILQLQKPVVSGSAQGAIVNKGNLVAVQAINVPSINQQQQAAPNKQQLSQFRQILPSTAQILPTVSSATTTVPSLTTTANNFASLLPSATSKPNVVAPNVNIQTLGLGNQVNSQVLQQQLLQQQKERQQQQQQKASPRLLAGQSTSNSNVLPAQVNASMALQQLNIAQQQRNANVVPAPKTGQQEIGASSIPQVISSNSSPQLSTSITPLHISQPSTVTVTVSAQQTVLSSPLISTSNGANQAIMSTMQQKPAQNGEVVPQNITGTVTPSNTSGLDTVNVVNSVPNVKPACGPTPAQQLQLQVMNSVTAAPQQPTHHQGEAPSRVATIQLTPQLQQALSTVQQKMKAILAVPNRTDTQNASLQQLMEWQQRIVLIGRSQALKAQQQQVQQQQPGQPQAVVQPQQPRLLQGNVATGLLQNPTTAQPLQQQQELRQVQQQLPVNGGPQQPSLATGAVGGTVQVQQFVTTAAQVNTSLTTTFASTTVVSPAVPNNHTGVVVQNAATPNQDNKPTITNINQLPPDMKEKLRLQLAKLNPSQLDYFLKNQAYVLTRLLKQQQDMQKQQQEQSAATAAAAAVVKAANEQKQAADAQQVGSTGKLRILAPSLSQTTVTVIPASNVKTSTANIISTGTVITTSQSPPHVTTVKPQVKMSRKQLFNHYITKDQKKIQTPDCKDPFLNHKDVLKKLLAYHVCQVKQDKTIDIWKGEEAYEETAQELLEKKDQMFKKYQYLILDESIRHDRTAEMVMLERMFVSSEREVLAKEKKQAAEDPDNFVPMPYLSMSSDDEDSGQDKAMDDSFTSPQHQHSSSSLMSPSGNTSLESASLSDTKHSSESLTEEPHSPGGNNYTLRASSGLKLVFRTSPMHNNVSSPAPLTENFSVKSEDSGICSQQNSVETIEESAPPRKKMRNSSEEKEHYRTSICDRRFNTIPNRTADVTAEKDKLPFQSYKEEDIKQESLKGVKFSDQDHVPAGQFQMKESDLDGFGLSEADTAVAGLLSSSDLLSQDLGAYNEDLFSGMTLEQHLSQGLPDDFMADSDKETDAKPTHEYYSEVSDYDTDAGEKEQNSELQDAIGGLLSDMDADRSYDNNISFHDHSDHFTSQSESQDLSQSSRMLQGSSDDAECTDETRSAIDSLLALDPSQDLDYI